MAGYAQETFPATEKVAACAALEQRLTDPQASSATALTCAHTGRPGASSRRFAESLVRRASKGVLPTRSGRSTRARVSVSGPCATARAFEDDDLVGQLCHLIGRVADVKNRDLELVVQPIRQDLLLAHVLKRRQRLVQPQAWVGALTASVSCPGCCRRSSVRRRTHPPYGRSRECPRSGSPARPAARRRQRRYRRDRCAASRQLRLAGQLSSGVGCWA